MSPDDKMHSRPSHELLALYGSLRRGQPPHVEFGLDRRLRFISPCVLSGLLHDFGEWPGLVAGQGRVVGELFEMVEPDTMQLLDGFEACDADHPEKGLFIRRLVPLVEPAATSASVYFYNRDPSAMPVITGGDWVRHLQARTALRG